MKRGRRKALLLIAALMLAALALSSGLDRLSRHRFQKGWALVEPGMSKQQVESLLGRPANVYPAQNVQSDSFFGTLLGNYVFDSFYEKWAYGRRRTLEKRPGFPYVGFALGGFMGPEDDDYVVYFSAQGKVLRKVHPYRAESTP